MHLLCDGSAHAVLQDAGDTPPGTCSACEGLIDQLRRQWEGAAQQPVIDQVAQLLEGRVSDFQLRALQAINDIPHGQVRTYGQLASQLGGRGLARAVGSACARNPLPLVIPCHRVVPSGGAVGRYSGPGGESSKRTLLQLEGAL
jgi:methylated-DNA-[protein]-cysteine S-methyltransferase